MNFYVILYILSSVIWIYWWYLVYKTYKNYFWFFFFLFSLFATIWFIFYFLFFIWFWNKDYLLFFSKACFLSWVLANLSIFLALFLFNTWKKELSKKKKLLILIIYISLITLYFSNNIISWLCFSKEEWVFREKYWILYWIHIFLQITFLVWFIILSFLKLKNQTYINKLRLKLIISLSYLSIFLVLIFQLFLPYFWIWVLEKEIVIIFMFFVISVIFVVKRYFFWSIWYSIWTFLIWTISILSSIIIINFFKIFYIELNAWFPSYWWRNLWYWPIDTIFWIILFLIINKFISKKFLWNAKKIELENKISKIEEKISTITILSELNVFLKREMQKIFKTNYSEIILYDQDNNKRELKKFFESKSKETFFINDIVFIEENKAKFNKEKIIKEIPKDAFLILPLYWWEDKKNIWVFCLWVKSFWDIYNLDEIEVIKTFIFFLEYHLKYIETYEKLEDLTVNLDKKVDEKTIEYNNLINKQKEFISMISHEIRSPISWAIFQADSIIDDVKNKNFDVNKLKNELEILNTLLIKTWDLSSKLFSVQYYDSNSITLYRERVKISSLLQTEYEVYSHINEDIKFINKIDQKMWFVEIDKIQFQQVIENILSNAIKFISKENWIISIESFIETWFLQVNIEDNWKWFDWIDISSVFDKYSVWSGNSVWLWMWLYLCKKIVEMHNWIITAWISQNLWWAIFSIKIPIK